MFHYIGMAAVFVICLLAIAGSGSNQRSRKVPASLVLRNRR